MAIDSRIALALQPLNIGQRMSRNIQNLQQMDLLNQQRQQAPFQNRLLELQTLLAESQTPAQIAAIEQTQSPLQQASNQLSLEQKVGLQTFQRIQPMLESGNTIGAIAELTSIKEQFPDLAAGIDEDILSIQTQPEVFKQEVNSALQQAGLVQRPPTATASGKDFEQFKALEARANQTGSQEDILAAEQFGRQAGFIRPTEEEKADIKVSEAERKETAKANAARKQGFIDSGIEAADSVANIKRSIELLKDVKTGGFNNALFRAKQLFGIEGADEGELSANLGRAVLAQLKPIFGAAFTAAEGERLERIEAGFGRSTETNLRLLENVLKTTERAARRGLAAAEDQGDTFTSEEIKEALATEIKLPEVSQETSPNIQQTARQAQQFTEGQTASNPETGQRLIYTNGQWVPYNG